MKLIYSLLLFSLCISSCTNEAMKTSHTFFVGGYTLSSFNGSGKGIYSCSLDTETGKMSINQVFDNATNPSYIAIHPNGQYLYTANETGGEQPGYVSAYKILENDSLEFINERYSRGDHPCHISLTKDARYLLIANYSGGSVVSMPIEANGGLGKFSGIVKHSGKGTFEERQEGPHAHYMGNAISDSLAFAVDLGTDKIYHYHIKENGRFGIRSMTSITAGTGPRHIAFHPTIKSAYVILEFTNTIEAYQYSDGTRPLEKFQVIKTMEKELPFYAATSSAIKIHPSGKFLYAGNRGIPDVTEDNIGMFSIHPQSGSLTFLGTVGTNGKIPRDFSIDPTGHFLVAANQESGNLISYKIDQETGLLTPTGHELKIPSGTCVVFKS